MANFLPSRSPSWLADHAENLQPSVAVFQDTDNILMAEVNLLRGQPVGRGSDASSIAQSYVDNPESSVFDVTSGRYKGMEVPERLRCAIFQSNVAVAAGLIRPGEVTVRALEFGSLLEKKGFSAQTFDPDQDYPTGSYIVGEGGHDGNEGRHVAMINDGRLVHTREGVVVNDPILSKFYEGSYDRITVYTPPA